MRIRLEDRAGASLELLRITSYNVCYTKLLRARIYLKREDLAHTGAHKINNVLGQALLARYMGKPRVIA